MTNPSPITWTVSDEHALAAVEWSSKKLHYSIDRPNMNARGLIESLDDKIMGDMATVAVIEYMRSAGIRTIGYDMIRTDSFQEPDPGWDIAFGRSANSWGRNAMSGDVNPKEPDSTLFTASVRSSRLPGADKDIQTAISRRDFKIFAQQGKSIEECITADIEMQVYFELNATHLGSLSVREEHVARCIKSRTECQAILEALSIQARYGQCYLTAWNFKSEIVAHSSRLSKQVWTSKKAGFSKTMWIAPLRFGKDMSALKTFAQGK